MSPVSGLRQLRISYRSALARRPVIPASGFAKAIEAAGIGLVRVGREAPRGSILMQTRSRAETWDLLPDS